MKKITFAILLISSIGFSQKSQAERQAALEAKKNRSKGIVEAAPTPAPTKQHNDPVLLGTIRKETIPAELVLLSITDEMDGSISYEASQKLSCFKDDKSIGFLITPRLKYDLSCEYIMLSAFKIGNCDEEGELTILFDDGSHLTRTSFASYNCRGNAAFETTPEVVSELSSKTMKKIRYTNGRTGEDYTHTVADADKDYFVRLFKLVSDRSYYRVQN